MKTTYLVTYSMFPFISGWRTERKFRSLARAKAFYTSAKGRRPRLTKVVAK